MQPPEYLHLLSDFWILVFSHSNSGCRQVHLNPALKENLSNQSYSQVDALPAEVISARIRMEGDNCNRCRCRCTNQALLLQKLAKDG